MAAVESTLTQPSSALPSLALEKDVAIGLVGEHAREIDAAVEARVLRKIDWFLIPAMVVGMLCCATLLSRVETSHC
jgi:hypothetical protein